MGDEHLGGAVDDPLAVWALSNPDDVRLGAAQPFTGISVLRRVMGRLASR